MDDGAKLIDDSCFGAKGTEKKTRSRSYGRNNSTLGTRMSLP